MYKDILAVYIMRQTIKKKHIYTYINKGRGINTYKRERARERERERERGVGILPSVPVTQDTI